MTKMANEIQIHSNRNEKRKLTHHVVKTANPARKTRFIRDTEIPGFALRIEPSGAMSWTYQFRYKTNDDRNGKTRLYTIGSCNPGSSEDIKSARKKADAIRIDIRDHNKYPSGGSARANNTSFPNTGSQNAITVADVVSFYLEDKKCTNRSGPHYWSQRIVIPYTGHIKLDDLKRGMVWRLRNKVIRKEKGETAAAFFVTYLKAAWNYALKYAVTELPNPAALVDATEKRVDKRPLNQEAYIALQRGLDTVSKFEGRNPFIVLAIEMMALTGFRKGEIANIEIDHIDQESKVITIPKHKNSHKKGQAGEPLYIPFKTGSRIDLILKKARKMRFERGISKQLSPYLFPSIDRLGNVKKTTVYRGIGARWDEIRKVEPILKKHRPKDLRAGWVTCGVNDLKIEKHVIAKANGREDVGTMSKNYLAAPETEEAFNSVSRAIEETMKRSA
jgi:integrase